MSTKHNVVTDLVVVARSGGSTSVKHIEIPFEKLFRKAEASKKEKGLDGYQILCREVINWGGLKCLDEEQHPTDTVIHVIGATVCTICTAEHNISFDFCRKIDGTQAKYRNIKNIKKLHAVREPGPLETVTVGLLVNAIGESIREEAIEPLLGLTSLLAKLAETGR